MKLVFYTLSDEQNVQITLMLIFAMMFQQWNQVPTFDNGWLKQWK
jgi:hypothetical protein